MVWLRASVLLGALGVLLQWACGTTDRAQQGAGTGGTSGTSSTAMAGGATVSGGSGEAGAEAAGGDASGGIGGSGATSVASTSGVGGSFTSAGGAGGSVVSTSGAAAAGGASPVPPIADEREREILSPLWIDPSALDAASGDELLELARAIALARGYVACRCMLSPDGPPADVEALFESCAVSEASPLVLGEADDFRCVSELRDEVPNLDTQLRCTATRALMQATTRLPVCTDLPAAPVWTADCVETTAFIQLQLKCIEAYYCSVDMLEFGQRCDGVQTCSDLSDEFQCFDEVGQDDVLCSDGKVVAAVEFCSSECEVPLPPSVCRPSENLYTFTCVDGVEIPTDSLCDREPDCLGGEDEAICFR